MTQRQWSSDLCRLVTSGTKSADSETTALIPQLRRDSQLEMELGIRISI